MKQEMNDGITGVHPFTGMDYWTGLLDYNLFLFCFVFLAFYSQT